jgi:fibronectin-binding autotransporter adhesin
VTHAGVIAGSGALVKLEGGTAALTGNNTFAGSVAVDGGTLLVGSESALGSAGNAVALNGGLLRTTPGAALTLQQAVSLAGGGFYVDGGSLRLAGGLTVDGTLDKQGSGELIIESAALNAPDGDRRGRRGGARDRRPALTHTLERDGAGDLIVRGGGRPRSDR